MQSGPLQRRESIALLGGAVSTWPLARAAVEPLTMSRGSAVYGHGPEPAFERIGPHWHSAASTAVLIPTSSAKSQNATKLAVLLSLSEKHRAEGSDFGNDEIEEGAHARGVSQVGMHQEINLRHKLGKRVYHPHELVRRISELYRQDRQADT
jgi:hypothetical protein